MRKIKPTKRKINFMLSEPVLMQLEKTIPKGKRSEFVNETLKEALLQFARKKALENIDKLAEESNLSISTEEFIKLKNYGRP